MNRVPVRLALPLALSLLLIACNKKSDSPAPTATDKAGETAAPAARPVSILASWGGGEQEAFQKVLDGFTAKTGIRVQYEQARDAQLLATLRTRVASKNPPSIAILPRPGFMVDLAREGALKPLTELGLSQEELDRGYSQAWQELGTVDGKLYGLVVKANSKSTIWYKPASFKALGLSVPGTWAELLAVSDKYVAAGKKPWAVGGGDGWTLTDWFENIYVRQAGPEKYTQLFGGKLPFTDPSVAAALKTMSGIVSNEKYVAGGRQGVLGTRFVDGIGRVFGKSPSAELYFEGGFVGPIALKSVNPELKPGEDIAFFPFPVIDAQFGSPLIGGGDVLAALVDSPEVRKLVQYVATKEAAELWAKTGAIVSPSKLVDRTVYPTELARAEADQVAGAAVFRFDGSDLLPGALGEAWGTALQEVVEKPEDIERILKEFEAKAAPELKR
ncbi:ABC transporter substrate-binding protein [Archangium sp.]|uniref:ABC transporter substrate-binding protein n=1 Tax=Archangium sp. TaxID=1872627 RepID=UPI002D2D80AD|nr:ABC transporter substrate-binding protein [Archangium sp.]HYO57463.1 ABC transporter substrate-binding protein [Archangium sp.]